MSTLTTVAQSCMLALILDATACTNTGAGSANSGEIPGQGSPSPGGSWGGPGGGSGGGSGFGGGLGGPGGVSLVGQWDVIATSSNGETSKASFELGPEQSTIAGAGRIAAIVHEGNGWVAGADAGYGLASTLLVPLNSPTMDVGAFPMNLSGNWRAIGAQPDRGCEWNLDGNVSAHCEKIHVEPYLVPKWLGNPDYDTFYGEHVDLRTSIFGDLGGTWHFQSTMGSDKCQMVIEGTRIDGTCSSGADARTFGLQIGDGIISGWSSEGMEFTAIRR
ncbi:MAG: hypothetical protein R3B13_15205 [Polyangiaceae bacterium]